MSYPTPANETYFELLVKKSRFIAMTGYANNSQQVREFLQQAASRFPDARHICHASILGTPGNGSCSCNDDGEPAGTAGKPILNVLQHSGIGDIVTVVARYFGGIKLGAGGLVRAYSNSASGSLTDLRTTVAETCLELEFLVDFALENEIRHLLLNANAREVSCSYGSQLLISCILPTSQHEHAVTRLNNITRGRVRFLKGLQP